MVSLFGRTVFAKKMTFDPSTTLSKVQASASYVENNLYVTGKDMKMTLREKAEIDEILEIKRLTAWRTCKRAKREMT